MEPPKICAKKPHLQKMEPGTYWWCSCGQSSHQPFCDGSHQGTKRAPVKMVIEEAQTVAWCLCKHTQNQPVCDGAHSCLPE